MSPRTHVGSSPEEKGVHLSSVGSKGRELGHYLEKGSGGKGICAREKAQGWNL